MFCAPRPVVGGTEGVGSSFHVLRDQTRFRRYRGRRVPFSCLALPTSFSTIPRASAPVIIFCATGHIFGGTEGSRFHDLRSQTHFHWYRGLSLPFSGLALPDSFSSVPWASCLVFLFYATELVFDGIRASVTIFMFGAPGLAFGGTEGVGSHFHILRSRTLFRRYRGRRVQFSCFALPDSFSVVPRALCPVFLFCVPVPGFGG
jgi:hypothetical protein